MASDDRAVRGANDAFYAAIATRNGEAMDALWSTARPVACIHPGAGLLVGREAVMGSWTRLFSGRRVPDIRVSDVHVSLFGDTAMVNCREIVTDGHGTKVVLLATNLFTREERSWRIVHHHVGPAPRVAPESEGTLRTRRRSMN